MIAPSSGDIAMQISWKASTVRFFVLLLAACGLCAQALAATPIWKISKEEHSFYLAGSIHMLRKQDWPLPASFDRIYAATDILALETNCNDALDLRIIMPYLLLPQGKTLRGVTNPSTYRAMADIATGLNIDLEAMQRLKPTVVYTELLMKLLARAGIWKQGPDMHYFSLAHKSGRSLAYLETVEEQFSVLFELDQASETEFLRHGLDELKNWDEEKARLFLLIDEWKTGKTAEAEKASAELQTQAPRYYRRLLLDRNAAWLAKLEHYLETQETEFVIVGYLHLVGHDGLLRQLAQRGYKVEQLQN
jgi:uncharacterized protein YbaP (TraB family)